MIDIQPTCIVLKLYVNYDDAMRLYGCDKPDIRFNMQFVYLDEIAKGKGFGIFDFIV